MALPVAMTVVLCQQAHAQFSYSWNHPANWGSPQHGGSQYFASFESVQLPTGVQVSVSGASGYGPTSTLPALCNPQLGGSHYHQGLYDGAFVLANSVDNSIGWPVGDLTLHFTTPVSFVGFSLGSMQPLTQFSINGQNQGEFLPKFSNLLTVEGGRQGYFKISGSQISTLTLHSRDLDVFVLDHLVFTPVPEPATVSVVGLGLMALTRRRKQ